MTPDDPTLGLVTAKAPKKTLKNLVKAGEDHDRGRPGVVQSRMDGQTQEQALDKYKDLAADYQMKAQTWKDSQERRDVRLNDLVKVHRHKPFDPSSASKVSKSAAQAVEAEKRALEVKQEAKKAVDEAWGTVQSFLGTEETRPLIPDEEEDGAE